MGPIYQYKAKLVKVVDGDTVDLEVDLGFYASVRTRFRLYGIDTKELRDKDPKNRAEALLAKERLRQLLEGEDLIVVSYKTDMYGRWLADIYRQDMTASVNETLLQENLAVPFVP